MSMADFMGRTIQVCSMLWGPFVFGDPVKDEDGGSATQIYTNYWGFEIDMLGALQETLNLR